MDRRSTLEVRIRKELKDFTLNMEFSAGKGCLGILGASGCGKSMTLKSIAGIVTPDEGRIVMEGEAGSHVLYDSALGINQKPQARNVGCLLYTSFRPQRGGPGRKCEHHKPERENCRGGRIPQHLRQREAFGVRGLFHRRRRCV